MFCNKCFQLIGPEGFKGHNPVCKGKPVTTDVSTEAKSVNVISSANLKKCSDCGLPVGAEGFKGHKPVCQSKSVAKAIVEPVLGGGGQPLPVANDSSSTATVSPQTEVPEVVDGLLTNSAKVEGKGSPPSLSGAKAKSNGSRKDTGNIPCNKFATGTCKWGEQCNFLHGAQAAAVCPEVGNKPPATASSEVSGGGGNSIEEKLESSGEVVSNNFLAFMLFFFGEKSVDFDYTVSDGFKEQEVKFNAFSLEERKYLSFCLKIIAYPGTACMDYEKFGNQGEIYDLAEAYTLFHQWCDDDDDEELALKARKVLKREALQKNKINITVEKAREIEDFAYANDGFFYWPDINGEDDSDSDDDL